MTCTCSYCENKEFYKAFTGEGKLKDNYMESLPSSVYERLDQLHSKLPSTTLMNELAEIMDDVNAIDNGLIGIALEIDNKETVERLLEIQERLY